jgi:hypothetical protein
MSATRVMRGAICLSASSHLVPIENSKLMKPVMFGRPDGPGSAPSLARPGQSPHENDRPC